MIRGTTPTFSLSIIGNPHLENAENIYVTIRQGTTIITLNNDRLRVEENIIFCWLTQEESLSLQDKSPAKIQVNWTYLENNVLKRTATKVKEISIGAQLLNSVIE